eukprot:GHUV01043822.1.p1 GENE.GHUV01043822.1~~GHUV01043822.1.p1  ORF type:complete len:107 (+),score=11.39 GHUV01043822.1:389-709(+)
MLFAASMRWIRFNLPMLLGSCRRQLVETSSFVRLGNSPMLSGKDSSLLFSKRSTCTVTASGSGQPVAEVLHLHGCAENKSDRHSMIELYSSNECCCRTPVHWVAKY